MALLRSEIERGEPNLPRVPDPSREATIERRGAPLGHVEGFAA